MLRSNLFQLPLKISSFPVLNLENQQLSLLSTSTPGMVTLYIEVTDDSLMSCTDSIIVNIIEDLTAINTRELTAIPEDHSLYYNYPNPFNSSTKIKFALPKSETVKIEVYNIIGQKLQTLLNKSMPAGYHEVEFNGQNLYSGIYLYRIETGDWSDVKKMLLVK